MLYKAWCADQNMYSYSINAVSAALKQYIMILNTDGVPWGMSCSVVYFM